MTENTINADVTIGGSADALLAGRYRVVKQLGQGGMGSVWLAEDAQLDNRQVAIKMLPSVLVSNKRAYNQLKAEALVSLKLTHPNIATVRAFEENGGNPFLVVDYIDGITLDDYLAEHCVATTPSSSHLGGLPEAEVIRLLVPIAAALDYAHSKGVIHRDVKPGNVMIAKDGTPYILDFGIAREIQETMTRVTGKLSSGTLMYMSPEQLHGAAPTPAQDVYSFAAMAYECLAGHPPFSRGQIEYQIEHDDPAPLDPQFANCGSGVMAGLAKRPEDRPTSCATVLAVTGTDRTVGTDRTASTGRARTPAAPHEDVMSHEPSVPHDGRTRAPPGPRRWPIIVALFAVVILVGAGLFHFFSVENEKRRNLAVAQASYERVRVSLKEQLRELEGVSHEDGFGSRIEEIQSRIPSESALRDAPSFLHAVECCERLEQESRRLVSANAFRIQAKSSCDAAKKSRQSAQSQNASQDAQQTWQEARTAFAEGRRLFSEFDFENAAQSFAQSAQLYGQAATEAEDVRAKRQKVKDAEELKLREAKGRQGETKEKQAATVAKPDNLETSSKERKLEQEIKTLEGLVSLLEEINKDPSTEGYKVKAFDDRQIRETCPLMVPELEKVSLAYSVWRKIVVDCEALLVSFTEEHPEVIGKNKEAQSAKERFADEVARALLCCRSILCVTQNQLKTVRDKRDQGLASLVGAVTVSDSRRKEIVGLREACVTARRQAEEAGASEFAKKEMTSAMEALADADKASEADRKQAYQKATRAFEQARQTAIEASKPKVTLKAVLNGEEVNATVVSGLKSKDVKTPVVVDLSGFGIGTSCEFGLAYVREGTNYKGLKSYTVRKGKGVLPIELHADEGGCEKTSSVMDSTVTALHVVRTGESLVGIARRYGLSIQEIKDLNRLSTYRLSVGQSLKVPKPAMILDVARHSSAGESMSLTTSDGKTRIGVCTGVKGEKVLFDHRSGRGTISSEFPVSEITELRRLGSEHERVNDGSLFDRKKSATISMKGCWQCVYTRTMEGIYHLNAWQNMGEIR